MGESGRLTAFWAISILGYELIMNYSDNSLSAAMFILERK